MGPGLAKHPSKKSIAIIGARDPGRALGAAKKVPGTAGEDALR